MPVAQLAGTCESAEPATPDASVRRPSERWQPLGVPCARLPPREGRRPGSPNILHCLRGQDTSVRLANALQNVWTAPDCENAHGSSATCRANCVTFLRDGTLAVPPCDGGSLGPEHGRASERPLGSGKERSASPLRLWPPSAVASCRSDGYRNRPCPLTGTGHTTRFRRTRAWQRRCAAGQTTTPLQGSTTSRSAACGSIPGASPLPQPHPNRSCALPLPRPVFRARFRPRLLRRRRVRVDQAHDRAGGPRRHYRSATCGRRLFSVNYFGRSCCLI